MNNARTLLLLLLIIMGSKCLLAQKEANIWYFGGKAGIDFNGGAPVALSNGQLNSREGCASLCDKNGQLLMYTDGRTVWDKTHTIMPNGSGLGGHVSSTQSSIIVPFPGSPTKFYIFTVDAWAGTHAQSTGNGGMNLNIVDLTLNGGLGDVTTKAQNILTPTCEKLTAARHCNGQDFWVVTHKWKSDEIYAYLLTNAGLSASPVITHTGVTQKDRGSDSAYEAIGYMKISPNGKKIALACYSYMHCVEIGDFDNQTGIISNIIVDSSFVANIQGLYGVSFSPDNSKLYVSSQDLAGSSVYQYDLSSGSAAGILSSRTTIKSSGEIFGALQLASNGKIYLAKSGSGKIDVIANPNALGNACNYINNGFTVGNIVSHYSEIGLPDFIENYLIPNFKASLHYEDCTGAYDIPFVDSNLSEPVTIAWDFGDAASGTYNTSTTPLASHTFSSSGDYTITATITYKCGTFSVSKKVSVQSAFSVSAGPDKSILPGNTTIIDGSSSVPGTYSWTPPTGLDNSTILQPSAFPQQTTVYTLHVTNDFGCTSTDSMVVSIDHSAHIYFPNAFSPNGDGRNDKYIYYAYGVKTIDLKIFDRWGELVFETNYMNISWDGTWDGKPEPTGTYVYEAIVTGLDGVSTLWKGNITLMR